jgi:CBS domain containing-hemolysin-like protein
MPVFDGELDQCSGYVLKEDLLAARLEGRTQVTVGELQRPLLEVRTSDSLHGCYEALVESSAHIALVRDTTQKVAGVITMEDLIETMLGHEIEDEDEPPTQGDRSNEDLQRRSQPDLPITNGDDAPTN